jgi:hypothetical protein
MVLISGGPSIERSLTWLNNSSHFILNRLVVLPNYRLRRIFEAARIEPESRLRKTDAEVLIRELTQLRSVTNRALALAKRKVELLSLLGARSAR